MIRNLSITGLVIVLIAGVYVGAVAQGLRDSSGMPTGAGQGRPGNGNMACPGYGECQIEAVGKEMFVGTVSAVNMSRNW
jgi:hypothetical protein